MAFKAKPSDLSFLNNAPITLSYDVEINHTTPEAVFEILKRPETWPHWFPDMTKAKWSSGKGAGVGAVRKVTLGHIITFEEAFLVWEPPYRLAYQINEVSIPFADELVEMFSIAKTPNGVRVTFQVGLRLHKLIRPAKLALMPVLKKSYKQVPYALKEYMEN